MLPTSARAAVRMLRRAAALEDPVGQNPDPTGVALTVHKVLAEEMTHRERNLVRFTLADTAVAEIASDLSQLFTEAVEMYESLDACRRQISQHHESLKRLRMLEIRWRPDLREQVALLVRQTGNRIQDDAADLRRDLDRDIEAQNWRRERVWHLRGRGPIAAATCDTGDYRRYT